MNRKEFFVTVTVLVLLVLLFSASGVVAQSPTSTSGTISYSGRLNNDAGHSVTDGMYAFTFALYDAATGGNLLWSETQTGVSVKNGAFTARLGSVTPLPKEARIAKGWLVVSVRGPGETTFTTLAPRQALNATTPAAPSSPAAGPSCPHDHFGEKWSGDASSTPENFGLYVEDNATTGSNGNGVYAYSNSGFGVYGNSTSGNGVYGYSSSGFAMNAGNNATQSRDSGGWIKAMARVAGTSITRCYNSQTTGATVSTPPCGFSSTGSGGTYTVNFGFKVDDRFISITPEWGSSGVPSAVVDSFPTANQVKVRISADSAFFIIVY